MTSGPILNRRGFCACCLGAAAWPLMTRAAAADSAGLPQALELGVEGMTRLAPTVWAARLAPGLWLHTTTALIEGGVWFPANGLILERKGGSLLIDTGYMPERAEVLLDWSKRALVSPIVQAVATHFHNDRTGGIPGLERHGVVTVAQPLTCALARDRGLPVPRPIEGFGAGRHQLGAGCELYFPGEAHTRDNIVAWLPGRRVLFGGCMIKSATSDGLGNVADAVVGQWAGSVRNLQGRYAAARTVVPGHGTITGDPIGRTLSLLADAAPS